MARRRSRGSRRNKKTSKVKKNYKRSNRRSRFSRRNKKNSKVKKNYKRSNKSSRVLRRNKKTKKKKIRIRKNNIDSFIVEPQTGGSGSLAIGPGESADRTLEKRRMKSDAKKDAAERRKREETTRRANEVAYRSGRNAVTEDRNETLDEIESELHKLNGKLEDYNYDGNWEEYSRDHLLRDSTEQSGSNANLVMLDKDLMSLDFRGLNEFIDVYFARLYNEKHKTALEMIHKLFFLDMLELIKGVAAVNTEIGETLLTNLSEFMVLAKEAATANKELSSAENVPRPDQMTIQAAKQRVYNAFDVARMMDAANIVKDTILVNIESNDVVRKKIVTLIIKGYSYPYVGVSGKNIRINSILSGLEASLDDYVQEELFMSRLYYINPDGTEHYTRYQINEILGCQRWLNYARFFQLLHKCYKTHVKRSTKSADLLAEDLLEIGKICKGFKNDWKLHTRSIHYSVEDLEGYMQKAFNVMPDLMKGNSEEFEEILAKLTPVLSESDIFSMRWDELEEKKQELEAEFKEPIAGVPVAAAAAAAEEEEKDLWNCEICGKSKIPGSLKYCPVCTAMRGRKPNLKVKYKVSKSTEPKTVTDVSPEATQKSPEVSPVVDPYQTPKKPVKVKVQRGFDGKLRAHRWRGLEG